VIVWNGKGDRPLTDPTGSRITTGSFEIRTASSSNPAVFSPLSPLAVPLLLSSPVPRPVERDDLGLSSAGLLGRSTLMTVRISRKSEYVGM
jgi:hypothetical protein